MARYLVLSFDPNDDAEEFVRDWARHKDEEGFAPFKTPDGRVVEAEVVGLYAQPTQYCEKGMPQAHGAGYKMAGWARGQKFGWWICGVCKKPSKLWGTNVNAVIGAAYNLLGELLQEPTEEKEPV